MHKPPLVWLTLLIAAASVPTALAAANALPRNGEIAFTAQFDTPQLFSVRPNVSKVQRLTTDLAVTTSPSPRRTAARSRSPEGSTAARTSSS